MKTAITISIILFLFSFFAGFTFLWKQIKKWNSDTVKKILEKGIDTDADLEVRKTYNTSKKRWIYDVYGTFKDVTGSERRASILGSVTVRNPLMSPHEEPGIFLGVMSGNETESNICNLFSHKREPEKEVKYPGHPIKVKIRYYPEEIRILASIKKEYFAVLLSEIPDPQQISFKTE